MDANGHLNGAMPPLLRTDARKRQRGSHGYGSVAAAGVTPELGAEVTVSYSMYGQDQTAFTVTDTFTLVGYWDYDELMPVHYINISRDYADDIERQAVKNRFTAFPHRFECHAGFRHKHSRADGAGGYRSWLHMGQLYRSQQRPDRRQLGIYLIPAGVAARSGTCDRHSSFLLLVIFTGYLIIYNIFQISVVGDIRFYGLLKTIGTTPRQLKRIIRQQALLLCLIGIPAGLLLGYGIGAVLVPVVLRSTQLDAGITTISTSPVIFLGSMLFALLTVLLSCSKPGKMAAKVLRWRLPNIRM